MDHYNEYKRIIQEVEKIQNSMDQRSMEGNVILLQETLKQCNEIFGRINSKTNLLVLDVEV